MSDYQLPVQADCGKQAQFHKASRLSLYHMCLDKQNKYVSIHESQVYFTDMVVLIKPDMNCSRVIKDTKVCHGKRDLELDR